MSGLLNMLQLRHKDDVFVAECKDGPTQSRANHLRLDAWVLLKTWSPVTTIGYEIKVDRSDWTRDQKFHGYLPLCHLFYVVAEKGVVKDGELPDLVGLLEPVGQGSGRRLVQRRKAVRRDIQMPVDLLIYVLMSRATIIGEHPGQSKADRLRWWKAFVEEREEFSMIGKSVSRRMREIVTEAERRATDAERKAKALATADDVLREMGITSNRESWYLRQTIERVIQNSNGGALIKTLAETRERLQVLEHALKEASGQRAHVESA